MTGRSRLPRFIISIFVLRSATAWGPEASAAGRFDGAWSVTATAKTGTCTGPY